MNDYFTYPNCEAVGSLPDLIILYGQNGSGKTTVLNLIFHLLSSHPGKGHLTSIAKVPFKYLQVTLSDSTVVSASRDAGVDKFPILFSVSVAGGKPVQYSFIPDRMRDRYFHETIQRELIKQLLPIAQSKQLREKDRKAFQLKIQGNTAPKTRSPSNSDEDAHKRYIEALQSLNLSCYLMPTDRRMRSDALNASSVSTAPQPDINKEDIDVIAKARALYLREALVAAARYINRQIIRASNAGSKDTNDIFTELIARVAIENASAEEIDWGEDLAAAVNILNDLEKENARFSALGIAPELHFDSIVPVIQGAMDQQKSVLGKILKPYIDSLTARLRALEPVGDSIQTFLKILNSLFRHKYISFSPALGFSIKGPRQEQLDVEQLSSGEQQLLLMFCYLLVSNDGPSIFMIDEPEISLNVTWQRTLVEAMRTITKNSASQIVIATHSIELLTQYSDMVVPLDPLINQAAVSNYEDSQKED